MSSNGLTVAVMMAAQLATIALPRGSMAETSRAPKDLERFSGKVMKISPKQIEVQRGTEGNQEVVSFERDGSLPKNLKVGDTVTIYYKSEAHAVRVEPGQSDSTNKAGTAGGDANQVIDDRAFYSADVKSATPSSRPAG